MSSVSQFFFSSNNFFFFFRLSNTICCLVGYLDFMSMQDLVSPQEIGFRNMANRSYASLQIVCIQETMFPFYFNRKIYCYICCNMIVYMQGIGHGEGTSTQVILISFLLSNQFSFQIMFSEIYEIIRLKIYFVVKHVF